MARHLPEYKTPRGHFRPLLFSGGTGLRHGTACPRTSADPGPSPDTAPASLRTTASSSLNRGGRGRGGLTKLVSYPPFHASMRWLSEGFWGRGGGKGGRGERVAVTKTGGDNRERLCHREGRENVSRHLATPEILGGREEAQGPDWVGSFLSFTHSRHGSRLLSCKGFG